MVTEMEISELTTTISIQKITNTSKRRKTIMEVTITTQTEEVAMFQEVALILTISSLMITIITIILATEAEVVISLEDEL
jgi:hypothetical protein